MLFDCVKLLFESFYVKYKQGVFCFRYRSTDIKRAFLLYCNRINFNKYVGLSNKLYI